MNNLQTLLAELESIIDFNTSYQPLGTKPQIVHMEMAKELLTYLKRTEELVKALENVQSLVCREYCGITEPIDHHTYGTSLYP